MKLQILYNLNIYVIKSHMIPPYSHKSLPYAMNLPGLYILLRFGNIFLYN